MEEELLELFKEFYEKQDLIQKYNKKSFIHDYGLSELHCIDVIGKYEDPNVSLIAQKLALTRGAACKITKKLIAKGDICSYQRETNKKEIYFSLTNRGEKVFEAHEESHQIWLKQDIKFLERVSRVDKEVVRDFLKGFIEYLQEQIELAEADACS